MTSMIECVKRLEKFTIDNSPLLLTAFGVTGTLTTAYLTGKASIKAYKVIDAEYNRESEPGEPFGRDFPNKEKALMVWKLYIPAAISAGMTITCIVGSNRIGTRRAAAMAAAYSISEKAFAEYKDKVVEKFGENKERQVIDEVQQDRVNRNPVGEREVIIMSGNQLCYDSYSGRYFESDMETLKKAMNDLNHRIINDNYASLTDFYSLIGLEPTAVSDEVGWNVDKLLEILFTTTLATDGRPAIALEYRVEPIRDYFRLY